MPPLVIILSPALISASMACTFLRWRCWGMITMKYMMANMSPSGIKNPPKPPPEACNRIAAIIFFWSSPSSFDPRFQSPVICLLLSTRSANRLNSGGRLGVLSKKERQKHRAAGTAPALLHLRHPVFDSFWCPADGSPATKNPHPALPSFSPHPHSTPHHPLLTNSH